MDLLREYQKEHPEEMGELNLILKNSERIDLARKKRAEAKLKRVEECRRLLNEGRVKLYG